MESRKFGRYEIKAEIGRGGMATVYHAYDPRFEREVAIKVLPHEMLHDAQFRVRFEREAKTIAMLEHPAIVPVHDFGEEDGQPYFVMRYMTGGSLSDRMKKRAITIQDAARIMTHIAPALDEAHAKGIIHRDLKPSNILFDQFNEPYISDFGIAKLSESQTNVTGSAIIGTPAYMSPEQAQGENIDGRSDIYALGVILFEMLTGQQPYHGDTPMSVVVKQIIEPVPHILQIKPDLPPDTEIMIEKAMAKDRKERYQDVKSLSNALNAITRGERLIQGSPDLTAVVFSKTVAVPEHPSQTVATSLPPVEPAASPRLASQPVANPLASSQPAATPHTPSQPIADQQASSQSAATPHTPSQPIASPQPSSHPPEGTVIATRPLVPKLKAGEQVPGMTKPRKRIGLWAGLIVGILFLCILGAVGIGFLRNKIPFLGAPIPTQTQTLVQDSPVPTPMEPTETTVLVNLPIATDTPVPTNTMALQAVFKINANIRSGPGTMYPVLTVQTAGTQVQLLGRNHAGDWLAFALSGEKPGWVAATSLEVSSDTINSLTELKAPPVPTSPPLPTPTHGSGGSANTPQPTIAPP